MIKLRSAILLFSLIIFFPAIAVYSIAVSLNWHPYGGFAAYATSNAIASVIAQLPDDVADREFQSLCQQPTLIENNNWSLLTMSRKADCIRPTVKVPGDCNPFIFQRCETLVFNDKILKDPRILNAIANAARYPCLYIDKEYQETMEKILNHSYTNPSNRSTSEYNYNTCVKFHQYDWITVIKIVDDNSNEIITLRVRSVATGLR